MVFIVALAKCFHSFQGAFFVHDKVATRDFYVPSTFFPKSAQDPEDIVLSHSVVDLYAASMYVSQEAPLSRDVPSSRKENATIVYLQRTNRPLVRIAMHGELQVLALVEPPIECRE